MSAPPVRPIRALRDQQVLFHVGRQVHNPQFRHTVKCPTAQPTPTVRRNGTEANPQHPENLPGLPLQSPQHQRGCK
jgi:hypothetical protein